MSYRDKTYVIFDGDKNFWAYVYMLGWKKNERIDFDFENAHDLFPISSVASNEQYIKGKLKERFKSACQAIVLVGESTRYLHKYVRWELETVIELDLPLIVVNLDNKRSINMDLCPPLISAKSYLHIPYHPAIIKYALDHFPVTYRIRDKKYETPVKLPDTIYKQVGMD